eukprot:gnl/Chilomastix_cuspidata/3116.p1 GENE.gnl/Chilomastix_cuspidata/3116~~gnl/Chilomastix_cuspidata/3116.p1  ORF type:complete len:389 (-),score=116.60 gnl/Chilomastix_cuspidata/3116:874-1905(-)
MLRFPSVDVDELSRTAHIVHSVRRGVLRKVILALDLSVGLESRSIGIQLQKFFFEAASLFVEHFLAHNPISELALVALRDSTCVVLSQLSASAHFHLKALRESFSSSGEFSLANALTTAHHILAPAPAYTSKEVLLLTASHRTSDPAPAASLPTLQGAVERIAAIGARVSVIGWDAEVFAFRRTAARLGGFYVVPSTRAQLLEFVRAASMPAPVARGSRGPPVLEAVGFPERLIGQETTLCNCHLAVSPVTFRCPRCLTHTCRTGAPCPTCGLPLILFPHLERTRSHLRTFALFPPVEHPSKLRCAGCNCPAGPRFECPACHTQFCESCRDTALSLHGCPLCM